MKRLTCMAALTVLCALSACTREDSLPDPPVQMLVPCDPSALVGDPTACPPDQAAPADVDAGTD